MEVSGRTTAWSEDEVASLAKRALSFAKSGEVEVTLAGKSTDLTRFACNQIHQNVSERDLEVRVRVAVGNRVGRAATNDMSDEALARAVAHAEDLARHQPENPDFAGFARPQSYQKLASASAQTLAFEPVDRAAVVRHVCKDALAKDLTAAGSFSTGLHALAIANTNGLFAFHQHTLAEFNTVVMGEDSSGWAAATHLDASTIDGEALADEAIEKALRSRHPQDLEPGAYTVVLEEYAVLDLLQYLAYKGFGAEDVAEGRSFLSGRAGEHLMHRDISIWDDGLDLNGIPMPFDHEGTPKQRVEVITRGVAGEPVYDLKHARRAGRPSTGHCSAGGAFWEAGPQAINVFMGGGSHTKEEMLESVERGIWVTRFHYCNMIDSRSTTTTGMTRDGTFLIENGKLKTPLRNLRFTHPVLEALRNVDMVGLQTKLETNWFGGGNRAPALKIANFRFTGKTSF